MDAEAGLVWQLGVPTFGNTVKKKSKGVREENTALRGVDLLYMVLYQRARSFVPPVNMLTELTAT